VKGRGPMGGGSRKGGGGDDRVHLKVSFFGVGGGMWGGNRSSSKKNESYGWHVAVGRGKVEKSENQESV